MGSGRTSYPGQRSKTFEQEDPMELVGVELEEDLDGEALNDMALSFVEEYLRMGWDAERILRLFHSPAFRLPHNILRLKGEDYVRSLVESVDEIHAEIQRKMRDRV